MSKTFQAFLVLALVAGLVIAFDPQARSEVSSSWQAVEPTFNEWQDSIEVRFRELTAQGESDVEVNSESKPSAEETSDDDKMIQINWDAMWSALQKAWVDFTMRLKSAF